MALGNIYRVIQDVQGNIVPEVLATVLLAGTSTLATLFSDSAGTVSLPNPLSNNSTYGSYSLFVAAGLYDMQFVKSGYTFETQRNIAVDDPATGVTSITGTANQVLVSPAGGVGTLTLSTPQNLDPDAAIQFARLGLGTVAPALPVRLAVAGGLQVDAPVLVVDSINHRLGIGTAFPEYPVDVASQIRLASNVGLGMPPGTPLALGITPPANANVGVQVHNFDSAGGAIAYVGQVNFGTGKWNAYLSGSAGNYFAGNVGIATTEVSTYQLRVDGSVGLDSPTLVIDAVNNRVGLGTTTPQQGLDVAPAARFQLEVGMGMLPSANLALGITPSTTNPVAVQVHDWTTPASGSIAYVGQVVFGTGKWNCYMSGTAGNYFAGNVAINSTDTSAFQLHCNGGAGKPTGGTWADSTSFAHLKQHIRPLTHALATLLRLRGRQWEWADDQPALAAQHPGTQTGLVIEEVAEDLPAWVLRDASGTLVALQERGTTALFVEALREIVRRLEAVEAR